MSAQPFVAVVAVAVMVVAAAWTGQGLLRLLRISLPPAESALSGIAIGLGVQATALLGLSALGWMHPLLLWGAVVAPAFLGRGASRGFGAAAWREFSTLVAAARPTERIGLLVVLGVVTVMLVVGSLGPVQDWDSLMYHVQLPRLFLDAGRLHVPLDGLHVAYLGSIQFLYLPLLAVGASTGPAVLNAALVIALGLLVVVAGEQFLNRGSGVLAGIIIWGSSALLLVGMTPRIDITLIYFLLLTHLGVLRLGRDEHPRAAWRYVGLVAGLAIGVKYHALPYLAALAPFAVWMALRDPRRRGDGFKQLGVASGIALICALPWLVKNAVLFGAPLYPFFAERVVPPFIAAIQGSTAHPTTVSTEIYGALGQARESISLSGLLLRPAQLTVEGEAVAFTRNWLLWLAPLGLLAIRRDRLAVAILLLPAAAYLAIALGVFTKTNLRYLLPVIPAFALVSAEVFATLGAKIGNPRWWRPLVAAVALLLCLPALETVGTRKLTPLRVQIALGLQPPEALLAGDLQYLVASWFAEQTTPDARLLMLFDARGFYHERQTIQDNVLTNWPLLVATGATERCLANTGITHVLLNQPILGYYASRGLDPNVLLMREFGPFAERCLTPLANLNGVVIFAVK